MKPQSSQPAPPSEPQGAPQPVAYDNEGRPLYAHPPASPAPQQPQVVYMARPMEPHDPHISDEVKQKHEEACRRYPTLNLSAGEYVISAIRRHPIGLFSIWIVIGFIIFLLLVGLLFIISTLSSLSALGDNVNSPLLTFIFFMLAVLFVLGGVISTIVYNANRFFLTNESVIQNVQTSLFSKREQTVSLANIEDASFRQRGVIQHIFNYGSIRLSTQGDETTYRFDFVKNPQNQIMLLNNAVESFKNGRPVGDADT